MQLHAKAISIWFFPVFGMWNVKSSECVVSNRKLQTYLVCLQQKKVGLYWLKRKSIVIKPFKILTNISSVKKMNE